MPCISPLWSAFCHSSHQNEWHLYPFPVKTVSARHQPAAISPPRVSWLHTGVCAHLPLRNPSVMREALNCEHEHDCRTGRCAQIYPSVDNKRKINPPGVRSSLAATVPCGSVMLAPSRMAWASRWSLLSKALAAARNASQISFLPSKAGAVSQNSSLLLRSWPSVIG